MAVFATIPFIGEAASDAAGTVKVLDVAGVPGPRKPVFAAVGVGGRAAPKTVTPQVEKKAAAAAGPGGMSLIAVLAIALLGTAGAVFVFGKRKRGQTSADEDEELLMEAPAAGDVRTRALDPALFQQAREAEQPSSSTAKEEDTKMQPSPGEVNVMHEVPTPGLTEVKDTRSGDIFAADTAEKDAFFGVDREVPAALKPAAETTSVLKEMEAKDAFFEGAGPVQDIAPVPAPTVPTPMEVPSPPAEVEVVQPSPADVSVTHEAPAAELREVNDPKASDVLLAETAEKDAFFSEPSKEDPAEDEGPEPVEETQPVNEAAKPEEEEVRAEPSKEAEEGNKVPARAETPETPKQLMEVVSDAVLKEVAEQVATEGTETTEAGAAGKGGQHMHQPSAVVP